MSLEVFAEETLVREVQGISYLLNAQACIAEQGACFSHHILVNPGRGRAASCLHDDCTQVLRRNVQLIGIETYAALFAEVLPQEIDELAKIVLMASGMSSLLAIRQEISREDGEKFVCKRDELRTYAFVIEKLVGTGRDRVEEKTYQRIETLALAVAKWKNGKFLETGVMGQQFLE